MCEMWRPIPAMKLRQIDEPVFRSDLLEIFRAELASMESRLAEMRRAAEDWGKHRDWPWNGFVLSYATLGGSANWEKRVGPDYEFIYGWDILSELTAEARVDRLKNIPNPRFSGRVTDWLLASYYRIAREGGPSAVRASYLAQTTAEGRIAYIRSYPVGHTTRRWF